MLPAADLYAGGPAYPLSSLGVRLRVQPGGGFTVLAGVFQDNPPGGPFDATVSCLAPRRWGGNFNLRTGALFIAEVQYALNPAPPGQMRHGKHSDRPAGHLQAGLLVRHRRVPQPAIRHRRHARSPRPPATACRANCCTTTASMRWRIRWSGGPTRQSPAGAGRVRPPDGRAGRPQPDQLQRRRRCDPEGTVARTRQRHARPRLRRRQGEQRRARVRCRHGVLHRHALIRSAPARRSSS